MNYARCPSLNIPQPAHIAIRNDRFGGGLAGSFLLHAAVAAAAGRLGLVSHSGQNWGETPQRHRRRHPGHHGQRPPLLPPAAHHEPGQRPRHRDPVPRARAARAQSRRSSQAQRHPHPVKPTKPVKTADKTTPPPPLHPQPTQPNLNKAPAGEAASISIPMSSSQTRAGTFSVGETDAAFGAAFAYYNEQIKRRSKRSG